LLNEIFKALSDPTRREILRLLRAGDMSAGELADKFDLAKSTLSAHFTVLKHAGLIVQEKKKTTVVYSLNISAVEEITAAVIGMVEKKKSAPKKRKP
jgi:DNA-binding transcriptional ArsR family regulator